MSYCSYYQAIVVREKMWFVVAVCRSFEHLLFDRAFDKASCTFEFFVPKDLEPYFLVLMNYFIEKQIISNLVRLPNRLEENVNQAFQTY